MNTIGLSDDALRLVCGELTDMLVGEVEEVVRQRSGASVSSDGSTDGVSRTASRVETSTLQDLALVDELLREFVDAPIESLRRTRARDDRLARIAVQVPGWLNKTIVAAAFNAFSIVMDREKDMASPPAHVRPRSSLARRVSFALRSPNTDSCVFGIGLVLRTLLWAKLPP